MTRGFKTHSDTGEGGNTKPPPHKARSWVLTWNNPPDTADTQICTLCDQYTFQHEMGENGTKHIQAVIRWKNARTFDQVKQMFPSCHIEECKNWKAANAYCSKSETRIKPYVSNVIDQPIIDPIDCTEKADWMVEIDEIIQQKPDPRKIYWFWESEGNRGKSAYCKHLCLTHTNVICVDGKTRDILFAIAQMKMKPTLILYDIERGAHQYVNYRALEKLKNGLFFSTKYESQMVVMNPPHVVCFSNHPPETKNLSQDRWIIKHI